MCFICEEKNIPLDLTSLDCTDCPTLTAIPSIQDLKVLWCVRCPTLTAIPSIPGLKKLICTRCPNLTTIPNMPGLKELYLYGCPNLTAIRSIPGLKKLICTKCPTLTAIPSIPGLEYLHCYDCPWIENNNAEFKNNVTNLIFLQRWSRKIILAKKIKKLSQLLIPIWWDPKCKGGYLYKKSLFTYAEGL
jgi:hypothetical protein